MGLNGRDNYLIHHFLNVRFVTNLRPSPAADALGWASRISALRASLVVGFRVGSPECVCHTCSIHMPTFSFDIIMWSRSLITSPIRMHHQNLSFEDELRKLLTENALDFDERYLWD